jgi:hypothetical protein
VLIDKLPDPVDVFVDHFEFLYAEGKEQRLAMAIAQVKFQYRMVFIFRFPHDVRQCVLHYTLLPPLGVTRSHLPRNVLLPAGGQGSLWDNLLAAKFAVPFALRLGDSSSLLKLGTH